MSLDIKFPHQQLWLPVYLWTLDLNHVSFIIDRSKIQCEKDKHLKRIDFEAGLIHENITAIYFDGRKDETLK